ncbi:class I SAM-dependent methyltransferase [Actinomadura keratinilytica]
MPFWARAHTLWALAHSSFCLRLRLAPRQGVRRARDRQHRAVARLERAGGAHWAAHQDRWNAVNDGFNAPLLDAARLAATGHVLDIGCGAGRTTRLAALRVPRGSALGLDLSGPMLAQARARAAREGVPNVSFVQGNAQTHPFEPGSFDAVISRYGAMFFADPVAAFTHLHAAVRPGGRLALISPADPRRNGWVTAMASLRGILPLGDFGRAGTPGMFSLADPDHTRRLLTSAAGPPSASSPSRRTGAGARTPRTPPSSCSPPAPAAT